MKDTYGAPYNRAPADAHSIDGVARLRDCDLAGTSLLSMLTAKRFADERKRIQSVVDFLASDDLKPSRTSRGPIFRKDGDFVSLGGHRPHYCSEGRRVHGHTLDLHFRIGGGKRRTYYLPCEVGFEANLESARVLARYIQQVLSLAPACSSVEEAFQEFAYALADKVLLGMSEEQIAFANKNFGNRSRYSRRMGCWIELDMATPLDFGSAVFHTHRDRGYQSVFSKAAHRLSDWVMDEINAMPRILLLAAYREEVWLTGDWVKADARLDPRPIIAST